VKAPVLTVGDSAVFESAARAFHDGGVILYPTDTVYGIGGDPSEFDVVRRIHHIKGSSEGKPLLLLTDESHWRRRCPSRFFFPPAVMLPSTL
jgi:L-threonylcarbamoyladenylate synthase